MMQGDPMLEVKPVGTVIDRATGDWGIATATFSSDRLHRYRLSRLWDDTRPRVNFIMCNPSTADAHVLDPTVRRCMGYAQRWGMGSCEVTNIFALRSTDPGVLYAHADPVGNDDDVAILAAAGDADLVIAAWGIHGAYRERGRQVREILGAVDLFVLRTTKDGHPCHPLYLPRDLTPRRWS